MSKKRRWGLKVNRKELLVSVDIGKATHWGYWRVPGGGPESASFPFPNTRQGFAQFLRIIQAAQRRYQLERVVVGFESTGPYGHPLLHYLHARQVPLVQINPMHTKKLQELPDNSPLKDDRKDPAVIATVMELGQTLTVVVPTGVAADIRAVVRARAAVQQLRLAECHRLTSLLSQVFPEFLEVMHGVTSRSAQYLLAHYPTPAALLRAERTALEAEVHRVSRGRLGTARVAALRAAAQETIGVTAGLEGARVAIQGEVERLGLYERQLTEMEDRLTQLLAQIPEVAVLFSLKGVGVVTVATVVGEVGSLPAFPTQAALFKYVGLNLYERSSGQWKGQRRISKHGSGLVRHALFLAAVNMIRTNGLFHAYAQRQQARGKPAKVILTAVMRKILARMYAMVRDQQVYQPRTEYSQAA